MYHCNISNFTETQSTRSDLCWLHSLLSQLSHASITRISPHQHHILTPPSLPGQYLTSMSPAWSTNLILVWTVHLLWFSWGGWDCCCCCRWYIDTKRWENLARQLRMKHYFSFFIYFISSIYQFIFSDSVVVYCLKYEYYFR